MEVREECSRQSTRANPDVLSTFGIVWPWRTGWQFTECYRQTWRIWEVRRCRSCWHQRPSLVVIVCKFLGPGWRCRKIWQLWVLMSYWTTNPSLRDYLTGQREQEWRRGIAALSFSKLRGHSKILLCASRVSGRGGLDRLAAQSGRLSDKQRLFDGSGEKSPSWMLVFSPLHKRPLWTFT